MWTSVAFANVSVNWWPLTVTVPVPCVGEQAQMYGIDPEALSPLGSVKVALTFVCDSDPRTDARM